MTCSFTYITGEDDFRRQLFVVRPCTCTRVPLCHRETPCRRMKEMQANQCSEPSSPILRAVSLDKPCWPCNCVAAIAEQDTQSATVTLSMSDCVGCSAPAYLFCERSSLRTISAILEGFSVVFSFLVQEVSQPCLIDLWPVRTLLFPNKALLAE